MVERGEEEEAGDTQQYDESSDTYQRTQQTHHTCSTSLIKFKSFCRRLLEWAPVVVYHPVESCKTRKQILHSGVRTASCSERM